MDNNIFKVLSLICVITTIEAATLGQYCNVTITCDYTGGFCNASSKCDCDTGYGEISGECKSSSITVSLSEPVRSVLYGSSTSLMATITTSVGLSAVLWQKVGSGGSVTNINLDSTKYTQTGEPGTGTVVLTINKLEYTDEGSYQVQMTNSLGKTSTSNQVSVDVAGGPPSVSVSGLTQSGDSVIIGCNATVTTDSPAITAIRWTKDGTDINMATPNGKYSGGNVTIPALTINTVDSGDAGVYRCVATNPAGSTTSDNDVTLAPPSDVKVTGPSSVVHSSTATFIGSYTSVLPSVTIKWQKQGTDNNYKDIDIGSSDGKYSGSSITGPSPKLIINAVKFTDRTSYRMVVNNNVGSSNSDPFAMDVTGGELTVTTGPNVIGRVGRSGTITCTVEGPEINKIQWKKYRDNTQNIIIDGTKYSGGSVSTPSLIINSMTSNDTGQYQCTSGNPSGIYLSDDKATVHVLYGQFNEDCNVTIPCDDSSYLICNNGKCLCNTTSYHKNKVCHPRTRFTPSISVINSTKLQFSVFWSRPSVDYDLVVGYTVSWRQNDGTTSDQMVDRGKNSAIVNSDLMSGQLYIVTVSAVVRLTIPDETITVTSQEKDVRLDPLPPGAILHSESSFAHDNLTLKWTPPSNTFLTSYEVIIDGVIQSTGNDNPWLHFTMKSLTPGKYYVVSIVTISGTSSESTGIKRSTAYTETIRVTPTKPGPPINVNCPQHPKDISLEISWEPPINPNGQIVMYQIHVNPGSPTGLSINTANNRTDYNVMGLSPEEMYNFTVRTINDAAETQKFSDPSGTINCSTIHGVSTPPTKLNINEIRSRGFKISFEKPVNVNGQLAGYRIIILEGSACVQEIFLEGNCPICKHLVDCRNPKFIQQADINQQVVHQVTKLKPYTHYLVKVAAVNGNGEGRFNNATAKTEEETPQKPRSIRATYIEAKTLTLSWDVAGPSPGNTTYKIEVHEGTDDSGTKFILRQPKLYAYGFHMKSLSIAALEEYWPYKFKVIAATVKGTNESDLSDIVKTKQAAPGKVENLTVNLKEGNYRVAYTYWNIPSLRDRNGVLENYHFTITNQGRDIFTGTIPVSLSIQRVEQNFTVVPEETYTVSVYVMNNESMSGQNAQQDYRVPAGRPPIYTTVDLISTVPGQHKSSQQTITVELYTDFFRNDLNGKQVLFGITVCEESKCKDQGSLSMNENWERLPNWQDASKSGFPLYRVTNQTYMDEINSGGSRWKRSTSSEFTIGEDPACSSMASTVYCNGPLNSGQSYRVILFACTNGGCSHSVQYGPYSTVKIPERVDNSAGVIVGSIIGVIGVFVIAIVVLVFLKRRHRKNRNQNDGNTYADLEFNERNKNEQVYLKLERGTQPEKTSIPVHQFVSRMVDVMRDSKLKIYREFSNLLLSTGRESKRIGESKINLPRNRTNAIPYDFNRVKFLEGKKGSRNDYINASFILEQHYIMTQSPLPKTTGNFWQMVWEQNAPSIVVLSDDDNENIKDEQYLPVTDGTVLSMGGVDIELLATFNILERATLRKIRLSKNSFLRGRELKNVNHYQVSGLKMANLSEELLSFINLVKSNERDVNETGPLIVHGGCSGTDYSGVFITTDYLIKSIDSGAKDVDVYRIALSVMNERMSAINTEEQYSTIYICLQKYLASKADVKTCYENSERKSAAGTYEYLP